MSPAQLASGLPEAEARRTPAPRTPVTLVTLVTGTSAAQRERTIGAALGTSGAPPGAELASTVCAVILEGLPDGQSVLEASPTLLISRIAPGCLCCTGNLVLRVTLNRILRGRPARLFIGLASIDHLDQLRSWLQQSPYDQLLQLTPERDS